MTTNPSKSTGLTLIELLIAIGVIGIISAIAVPAYNGYIETSVKSVMRDNIENLRLFEEQYKLEKRTYVNGTFNPASPNAAGGLKALLGWDPGSNLQITYVVSGASKTGFTVDATDAETGFTASESYPY